MGSSIAQGGKPGQSAKCRVAFKHPLAADALKEEGHCPAPLPLFHALAQGGTRPRSGEVPEGEEEAEAEAGTRRCGPRG